MATEYRPIPRLAVGVYPLTNVTPFTYRDGVTYERLLHQLIDRMNTIIGEVNTNNQALFDVVIENMNITIDAVNAALGEQTDEVDQKLADLTEYVNTEVQKVVDMRDEMAELRDETEAFRNQAEVFSATTVELQDTAVKAIIVESNGIVLPTNADSSDLTYELLQDACDVAALNDLMVVANGEITTDQTLTIRSHADLSRVVINYTGDGVAVRTEGETPSLPLISKTITTPVVKCSTKPGDGEWSSGTVGVSLYNTHSCFIVLSGISLFETGVDVTAFQTGNVYNTVIIKTLENNMVNMWLNPLTDGWVNQNTFIGGAYSHYSNEGIDIPGTKHIHITQGNGHPVNMNFWLNPCIETGPGIVEYAIDIEVGLYNVFQNPRIEASGALKMRVRWGAGAQRNTIRDGYALNQKLEQVWDGGMNNYIDSQGLVEQQASVSTVMNRYSSSTSAGSALFGLYEPETIEVNGFTPLEDYSVLASAQTLRGKQKTDEYDRVRINWNTGRVYFGSGSVALTKFIGVIGNEIGVYDSHLFFAPHNTKDLGGSDVAPRFVFAGTAIRPPVFTTANRPTPADAGVGGMVFDSTLKIPVWSTGTDWVDSAGDPA